MSELQDIAANVDAVAGEIGTVVQQLTAQAVRNRQTAAQANAVLAGSADPRPKQVNQQLDTAAQRCEQAAQALQLAQQAAKQFVGRIVGGGGSGSGPTSTTEPSAGGHRAQTIGAIKGWLGEINAGGSSDPFDPRSKNCGQCALAVYQRLSGRDESASAGIGTLSVAGMADATGRQQKATTPEKIQSALIEAGPGSHCVVGIDRNDAPGHWFNAYYDGSSIFAIDGQSGEVLDWPPEYGSTEHPVVYWDANV